MLYDISATIDARLAGWLNSKGFRHEKTCEIDTGATVTCSVLHLDVHMGTHFDGPCHYGRSQPGVEWIDLERCIGPCQVVTANVPRGIDPTGSGKDGHRVAIAHLAARVTEPRVLIRTRTYDDPTRFTEDFAGLEPALIESLAAGGVRLIGVDTPSVDTCHSKDLPAHKAFLRSGTAILEGLRLDSVPDGVYELLALPLKLPGFDGSPTRAVLRAADARR